MRRQSKSHSALGSNPTSAIPWLCDLASGNAPLYAAVFPVRTGENATAASLGAPKSSHRKQVLWVGPGTPRGLQRSGCPRAVCSGPGEAQEGLSARLVPGQAGRRNACALPASPTPARAGVRSAQRPALRKAARRAHPPCGAAGTPAGWGAPAVTAATRRGPAGPPTHRPHAARSPLTRAD